MRIPTLIIGLVLMLGIVTGGVASVNLPMRDARAVARIEQELVNRRWDPTGICRAPTRYSVRCTFSGGGHRWLKVFSKVGTHRLRISLSGDGGTIGPVTQTITLPKSDHLYPYV